jgi:hypothetical protein
MQQQVAKPCHEDGWNNRESNERKDQLGSKLGTQLLASSLEIKLEQIAEQDEGANDQQDDIDGGERPEEQGGIAVWGRTEVRAEVQNLLQHREHEQNCDHGGEKDDEPFLPFRVPAIHERDPWSLSAAS